MRPVSSEMELKQKGEKCRVCTPPGRNDSNTLSVIHANSRKTGSDVLQNVASA